MTSVMVAGSTCASALTGVASPAASSVIFSGLIVIWCPSRSITLETPMKSATNAVAGRSYTSTGLPICSILP